MRKRVFIRITSFLCAGLLALFGAFLAARGRAVRGERAALYAAQRAFGELTTGLTELDAALHKSLYASGAAAGPLFTQVYGKAQTAQMALGVLPYSTAELEKTAGFISRVGDYALALSRAAARGEAVTDEQRESLAALADVSGVLAENLRQLRLEMADGRLTAREQQDGLARADAAEDALPASLADGLRLAEQEFPELPALIYDGPFSAHLDRAEPLALEGLPAFSAAEAETQARAFFELAQAGSGDTPLQSASRTASPRGEAMGAAGAAGVKAVRALGKSEGRLPTFDFSARLGGADAFLSLSARGGKPVLLLVSREIGARALSDEEALSRARQYVEQYGFSDMVSSYHMIQGGVMTVNFAYEQSGVVCWADLVKVGVALDDGGLVSLETRGWLMNHRVRDIPAPAVSEAEAAEKIGPGLTAQSQRLALVPRPGGEEVFCREFTCVNAAGERFVVCVDARTGEQEKILILLEDESGSLTI